MTVRFDESLGVLLDTVTAALGSDAIEKAAFVRDASGRLSVILDQELQPTEITSLEQKVRDAIGSYARAIDCVRDVNGPGARRLLQEAKDRPLVQTGSQKIHLVDRRMIGADWLLPPAGATGIPRIAFCSLKGGVGRSTALAILAAHLSSRGQRVLAIDLDLEAPGIGTMLVDPAALSTYGTLDFLVEDGISGVDDRFLQDLVAKSYLGKSGAQVSVVPATGTATIENPSNALAKIARAYLEDVLEGGETRSLTDQISSLVDRLASSGEYDVVLLDGRAGLHEVSAPIMLGLGAEVLLFGIDEPQTFLGYRLLLSHMAQYDGPAYAEWRRRLTFVHAKASADPDAQQTALQRFGDLLRATDRSDPSPPLQTELDQDDFEFNWLDDNDDGTVLDDVLEDDVPLITILDDARYRGFDPIYEQRLLTSDLFGATFGQLIAWSESVIPALSDDPS